MIGIENMTTEKNVYETPQMEIIMFETQDVIATSGLLLLKNGYGEEAQW